MTGKMICHSASFERIDNLISFGHNSWPSGSVPGLRRTSIYLIDLLPLHEEAWSLQGELNALWNQ